MPKNLNDYRPAGIVIPAEDLSQIAVRINSREHKSKTDVVDHACKQGRDLLKAKKLCGHGNWMRWCRENVEIALDTVNRYMRFADRIRDSLNLTVDQKYELWQRIQGSPKYREEPIKERDDGPTLSPASEEEQYDDNENEDVDGTEDIDNEVDEEGETLEDNVDTSSTSRKPVRPVFLKPRVPLPTTDEPTVESSKDANGNRSRNGERGRTVFTLEDWKELTESEKEKLLHKVGTSKFNAQDSNSIEWALWSWNPVTGCLHDCPYCYARDIANRFYITKFEPALWPERITAPRVTPFPVKEAEKWIGHKNVFVCSMADLFGRWVPSEWIETVLKQCAEATQWNFLFLTKFPNRMSEFEFSDNCWVGTTVDCQARVRNAEKSFRKVKAKVKWLSCEPLIESLKFQDIATFNWIVIGGASKSTKTPAWIPPRRWVVKLEAAMWNSGGNVYEKTNLFSTDIGEARIREYPEVSIDNVTAPKDIVYLPPEIG